MIAVGILSFFLGIALTLYLFTNEIYHGQKVGYGPNDIHPDRVMVHAADTYHQHSINHR